MTKRLFWLPVLFVIGAVTLALANYALQPVIGAKPSDQQLADRLVSIINANGDFSAGTIVVIDVTQQVCPWVMQEELDALVDQPGWQFTAHSDNRDERTYWFKKTAFIWTDQKGLQIGLKSEKGCYAYVRRSDAV